MKIVVGVDSSRYAEKILQETARRVWPDGTEFRVLTAVELTGLWDADQQFLHQAQVILNQRLAMLKKQLPDRTKVGGEIVGGSAASVVNNMAREWNADLIIIGSHGDTGARRKRLGSVAAAIVNNAPCTVEVIKLNKAPQQLLKSSGQKEMLA